MNVAILKTVKHLVVVPLTKIINQCLAKHIFPDCLKLARVVPVFKKGSPDDISNYRPISILPIFGKIFECVLKQQINAHFEDNELFNPCQFGFRSNVSTTAAINYLTAFVRDCFEMKKYAQACFLDLSKAFDCVSHELLLNKLKTYGFEEGSTELICSYLTNRQQYVSFNQQTSKPCPVKLGVPQGSVLGPILFLIYINDINTCLKNRNNIVLFADDTTVLSSDECLSQLQGQVLEDESRIRDWFVSNKLCINATKTQSLIFSLKPLRAVNEPIKFLGIYLDSKLAWGEHTLHLAKKLHTVVFLLRNLRSVVSHDVLLSSYYGYFHSHLSYAILCWGHSAHALRIFAVQRRCIRVICGMGYRDCCRDKFVKLNILTVPCIYILACLLYIKDNLDQYAKNSDYHNYNTRTRQNLCINYTRTERARDGHSHYGIKFFNILPQNIKDLSCIAFRTKLKNYLKLKAFYNFGEYLNHTFLDLT